MRADNVGAHAVATHEVIDLDTPTTRAAGAALAVAAAMVLTAPNATADIADLSIYQGHSNGYGAGCSYTITATVTVGQTVLFSDSAGAAFTPDPQITPAGDAATVNWIPSTPGMHLISARQGASVRTTPINVGTGVSTGSTSCQVFPW